MTVLREAKYNFLNPGVINGYKQTPAVWLTRGIDGHYDISNSFTAEEAAEAPALFGDFVFFADIFIHTYSWPFSEFKRNI